MWKEEYISLAGFNATTTPLAENWFWYSESKRAGKATGENRELAEMGEVRRPMKIIMMVI